MSRQHGDHLRSWTGAPDSEAVTRPAGFRGGKVRGKLTRQAPLAKLVWFKSGGEADWLFEPEDLADLIVFLAGLEEGTPVMALGLAAGLEPDQPGERCAARQLAADLATAEACGARDVFRIRSPGPRPQMIAVLAAHAASLLCAAIRSASPAAHLVMSPAPRQTT